MQMENTMVLTYLKNTDGTRDHDLKNYQGKYRRFSSYTRQKISHLPTSLRNPDFKSP